MKPMRPGGSGARSARPASQLHETVVASPGRVRALIWIGFPLVGVGVGWLLLSVAGWVSSLPWAPWQGPFELVASVADHPLATVGALVVGGVAGLVLAFLAWQDDLAVTVSRGGVVLKRGGSSSRVDRDAAEAVFMDGNHLVLLGGSAEELAREKTDLSGDRLRAAFEAHGFPWRPGGDPYIDDFRRWVEGMPGLPAGADALLKARERALSKGDGRDVTELRTELAKLGVVVREEGKRQYWRRTRG